MILAYTPNSGSKPALTYHPPR